MLLPSLQNVRKRFSLSEPTQLKKHKLQYLIILLLVDSTCFSLLMVTQIIVMYPDTRVRTGAMRSFVQVSKFNESNSGELYPFVLTPLRQYLVSTYFNQQIINFKSNLHEDNIQDPLFALDKNNSQNQIYHNVRQDSDNLVLRFLWIFREEKMLHSLLRQRIISKSSSTTRFAIS